MKIRKRYILLILIALLPLHKLIHQEDYCFGEDDLVIIGVYAVMFFVVFLVIVFNNFYMITLKRELFNIRPIIIGVVYALCLGLLLIYHDKEPFKTETASYLLEDNELDPTRVVLFKNNTFDYQKTSNRVISNNLVTTVCHSKGTYKIDKDSIFFNFQNKELNGINLDTAYNNSEEFLFPKNDSFDKLSLENK